MAPELLALVFGFNIKLIHSTVDMGTETSQPPHANSSA